MANRKFFELDDGEGSAAQRTGWPTPVKWLQRISDFANLESLFIENGLSETEAEKILGKNWFNFYQKSLKPL